MSAAALATVFAGLSLSEAASAAAVPTNAQGAALFPGEQVMRGAGFPALAMFRRADPTRPLMLFLPGGGHLARIAYGDPGSRPEDFLLTHLSDAGFSTLALSYPSAHASMNHPVADMTITQWAASAAAITAEVIAKETLNRRVIAIGWSLGGRLARDLALALQDQRIELDLFVGLSAAVPLPGFGSLEKSDLQLAPSGLLDGSSAHSSIFRSREAQLAVTDQINGRIVLDRDRYARLYVTDSPLNFRGEPERYRDRRVVTDIAAAITDQGSFDFGSYPLCASVAAAGPSDARHALADAAAWGMLNAQSIYLRSVKPSLAQHAPSPQQWAGLHQLMNGLTARLSRHVDGSHFFFLGEIGARATAQYIRDLVGEAVAIGSELSTLLTPERALDERR